MHQIKHILQLAESHDLNRGVDEASLVEVDGLGGIFAVADVTALDGDHADDCAEHGGLEEGVGGEADCYYSASLAYVLCNVRSGLG
jgi:hypothetical protein